MDQVQKLAVKLFDSIGSSRARRYAAYVRRGQWGLLQRESVSRPDVYQNASRFFDDAICVDFARKLLLPGDKDKRQKAALATFWASEAQCATTNARLSPFLSEQGPFGPGDEGVLSFIKIWRKEVYRVLGKAPGSYRLSPLFSKGSTLSDKGQLTTIPDKLSSKPTAYPRSLSTLDDFVYRTPLGARAPTIVRGNRFFTVPKDSEKDRGCCVEASLNISAQLSVGRWLRRQLLEKVGVDLDRGQNLHRRLARDASCGLRDLCTIDLSNASDTVARKLIELLVPRDWWVLLNSLRAPVTDVDGKTVWLEKFSSMGNGFTFELETIIFVTLARACGAREAYAYGDDIIVDTPCAAALLPALRYFGFTPNARKTFVSGPFRESCGGDYFEGTPVRAFFLKEVPDEPQKWITVANGIRRLDPDLKRFRSVWDFCVSSVPRHWRLFGPANLGDGHFHTEKYDVVMKTFKDPQGNAGDPVPCVRSHVPVNRSFKLTDYWAPDVALASAILGVPANVIPRDSVTGYKVTYIPIYGLADESAYLSIGIASSTV